MIAILDYGVGNLFSLSSSLRSLGQEPVVSSDPRLLDAANRFILPGVGAFADAAQKLRDAGLDGWIKEKVKAGSPLLGICLGMQLLFDVSYEFGEHPGLGLIPGKVVPMRGVVPDEYKVPHIGWNALDFTGKASPLFRYIQNRDHVYFVHSYYASDCGESVIATTEYGAVLTAAVQLDNVYGCQFHPEKSGRVGLNILKAFCEL